ncbi:MAG: tRNA lysidine(34) synthetase TilS [Candidatus Omnitrophica bacterium]|nr:tRNA lysidine(34) synthetase TilS [Candidatus Omnitrophota bacterium]MCF7894450.1 tRNA lysidine(34) synthetase TilS [Candidatus Omnitrophota bacterium]
MLKKTLLKTINEYDLLKRKDKVLLGVSGGPDSIALLYSFISLEKKYKLKIICVHFNHGLREESDREEKFIRDLCKRLEIEFISEKKMVNDFFTGDSLEQTARKLRFDFFLKVSRQTKIKKLALAHHKDDLAETVLMRIIRGTGLKGLRGFLPKSNFKSLTVVRPFIDLEKDQILNWLDKKNISFCLDKSNRSIKFLRNKIRIKLLPQLEAINESITDRLSDLAVNTGLDYDFIYNFSEREFRRLRQKKSGRGLSLDLKGLRELHPAIFNNVIRIAIEQIKGDTRRIDQAHLAEVKKLVLEGRDQASIHLPKVVIKKEKKAVSIQPLIL